MNRCHNRKWNDFCRIHSRVDFEIGVRFSSETLRIGDE